MKVWISNILSRLFKNAAFKVAFIYASFSILWILFSDQILLLFVKDARFLTTIQMLKGWFFVLTTSVIIFLLLKNEILKINQAKEKLTMEKVFSEKVINSMPGIFYAFDERHRLVKWNRNLEKLIGKGREEIDIGEVNLLDHIPGEEKPGYADAIKRLQKTGGNLSLEAHFIKANGKKIPMLYTASHIDFGTEKYFLGFGIDISGRKKLEAELQQAHKMEAIGTLAGGIAHDFNNILSAIFGYTELAKDEINDIDKLRDDLNEIMKGAERAKELVKQILTFSRKDDHELRPLKVQTIISEALKLLRSSIPTTIEIKHDINNNCNAVLADPGQIHQVVMNLCTNAYHAMRQTGGVLGVVLQPVELDGDTADTKLLRGPGPYIKLEISDTGVGIPKGIQKRIFEPYYTTKPKGEGTGLGLAVVHGIVTRLNGYIDVYSELNTGTTFRVYLPVAASIHEPVEKEDEAVLPGGNEKILIIDDDRAVSDITARKLEKLGYKVTRMTDSLEALERFRNAPDQFDLVITDMTMPNMTGEELAKNILKVRPDMKIILSTGFSDLITEEKAMAIGIKCYIMKPVVMKDLAETVRRILDTQ